MLAPRTGPMPGCSHTFALNLHGGGCAEKACGSNREVFMVRSTCEFGQGSWANIPWDGAPGSWPCVTGSQHNTCFPSAPLSLETCLPSFPIKRNRAMRQVRSQCAHLRNCNLHRQQRCGLGQQVHRTEFQATGQRGQTHEEAG